MTHPIVGWSLASISVLLAFILVFDDGSPSKHRLSPAASRLITAALLALYGTAAYFLITGR